MRLEFVVAGVVVDKDKVLLRFHPKLRKWLPPGGHVQPGETPDEALRRELREETGLIVELMDIIRLPSPVEGVKRELAIPFYANVHSVGDHDHYCFFYRCRIVGQAEKPPEPSALRWFDVSTIFTQNIPEDVKYIVELAVKRRA